MSKPKFESLGDIFAEEEERRTREARAEMAKEQAAYEALPEAEKARLAAEAESRWAALADAVEAAETNEEEEEEEE